ncbi:putative 2-dehydropantoate 2-reductase [Porphyridium purpureum]|uniref:Putative 2-dehydropantoate 2-reductase n=1 Tax=Porphyridium purpureum TaxID=35688 RepID=A0A5J4Z044_PORPP|nr:putative 2-dehydropantoate 2-reductase [Porphyridium purpureum]|eukprot:POR3975..scf208_2
MRVAVIGGGAIGLLFAARLVHCSFPGRLVVVTSKVREQQGGAHARAVNVYPRGRDAQQAWGVGSEALSVSLDCVETAQQAVDCLGGHADIALVALKSHAIGLPVNQQRIRDVLGPAPGHGVAVSLANGLGNLEALWSSVGMERSVVGVTYHGSHLDLNIVDNRFDVFHNGVGQTYLGATSFKQRKVLTEFANLFENDQGQRGLFGISVIDHGAAMDQVWKKFLVNCSLNPIASLFRLTNGEYKADEQAAKLRTAVLHEALALQNAMTPQNPFKFADIESLVLDVAERTGPNCNSMLQDLKAGKKTEIQALNGWVVKKSAELGLSHAACNHALTTLIENLEA